MSWTTFAWRVNVILYSSWSKILNHHIFWITHSKNEPIYTKWHYARKCISCGSLAICLVKLCCYSSPKTTVGHLCILKWCISLAWTDYSMTYFLGPLSTSGIRVIFHSRHSKMNITLYIAHWTPHRIVYCHFQSLCIWDVQINTEIYIEAFAIIFTSESQFRYLFT